MNIWQFMAVTKGLSEEEKQLELMQRIAFREMVRAVIARFGWWG